MNPILAILLAALPYAPALIADIKALFTKYPQMTPAQIAAAVTAASNQADAEFTAALEAIAADQAAQAKPQ